jgi:triphosphoribosyl-dephospho-CoA synthase
VTCDLPAFDRTPDDIGLAAQAACLLEVSAPKPGNVGRSTGFADARFEDFLLSALAIGPAMRQASHDCVGQIIWNAVSATRRLVHTNTNLGTVLLMAPLARAMMKVGELRANLARVLAELTVEDARLAYLAIRLAGAGGLGRVSDADVGDEPAITLRDAMALAEDRDTIAREYATDFAVTFDLALPALEEACRLAGDITPAMVQAYLVVLANVPDTLIARKLGRAAAERVSREAALVLQAGGALTDAGRQALASFDRSLRDDRHLLNPGTTADIMAAATFIHLLGPQATGRGKE